MRAALELHIAGEPVQLLADRALYWPRHRRLLIADLHLGKADVFRRAGIGLPRGGTTHDLQRLDALVDATGATALWVLGDVLHGPAPDAAWRARWGAWREANPELHVAALVGNHDRALAQAGLGIELLGEAHDDAPFALRHEPEDHPSLHVLCGHLHPCIGLPGLGPRRWPAFWLRERMTVLPAFSAFTGGVAIAPSAREVVAICADGVITSVRGHGHSRGEATGSPRHRGR
ncbi:ligase-associated DNA damage response endonuclease PdeM [Cognatilysobacter bugurensis]|uniref:Phosphoesterase n=1 Tax=Cognatilysobacter bugurensis TaxID=543356 RepID=A0A918SUI8_9GAMM|nr:ligase-associated DNA damage response endonuclease PdeM [Lysobacter bugurensis]GHA71934.1 phosphoesterase [Lysobacter bugurensis]